MSGQGAPVCTVFWPLTSRDPSEDLPYKWRRELLQGLVGSALLSGLEPLVLTESDYSKLDSRMAALCRFAMLGKACAEKSTGHK
eukprot:3302391-Pyramimonas_sp.AAC.1